MVGFLTLTRDRVEAAEAGISLASRRTQVPTNCTDLSGYPWRLARQILRPSSSLLLSKVHCGPLRSLLPKVTCVTGFKLLFHVSILDNRL